jgi:DnaK suppressor protein
MFSKKGLSPAFIEEMKTALLEEKTKLETELSHFAHRNPQSAEAIEATYQDTGSDEGENAFEVAQFSDNLSLEQELENALKDATGALKAIDSGTYGICKYCKQPISEDRLRIRPTSTSCVACKKTLTQEL